MNVRYIGESEPATLTSGKIYDILSVENGWYRIMVDFDEDYLYPSRLFEIVEE